MCCQRNGTAKPSFISYLLDEYERKSKVDEEHEQDIKAVGGVLYGAGVETVCTQQLLFWCRSFVTEYFAVRVISLDVHARYGPLP